MASNISNLSLLNLDLIKWTIPVEYLIANLNLVLHLPSSKIHANAHFLCLPTSSFRSSILYTSPLCHPVIDSFRSLLQCLLTLLVHTCTTFPTSSLGKQAKLLQCQAQLIDSAAISFRFKVKVLDSEGISEKQVPCIVPIDMCTSYHIWKPPLHCTGLSICPYLQCACALILTANRSKRQGGDWSDWNILPVKSFHVAQWQWPLRQRHSIVQIMHWTHGRIPSAS